MSTTNATVPAPRRPPTAHDGFARVLPDPVRCAADLLLAVPFGLAVLAGRHAGTTFDGNVITRHASWEQPALHAAAALAWLATAALSFRGVSRFRPHALVVFGGLVLWAVGASVHATARLTLLLDRTDVPGVGVLRVVRVRHGLGIARERPCAPWHEQAELLADPLTARGRVQLLRPNAREFPRLLQDQDLLALIADDGGCELAVDPQTCAEVPSHRLGDISPFALLGADDAGRADDLASLETLCRGGSPGPWVQSTQPPRERVLLDALDSPNPWVRDAARRLISAGGPGTYPEATKRL